MKTKGIKITKFLLITGIVMTICSCNSGSSTTPSGGGNTQYNLQNYKLSVLQTGNCTLSGDSTLNCDSNATFAGVYSVTFNTPTNVPGAYVQLPTSEVFGVTIAPSGDGCPQEAPDSGATYTCNFTMAANGTAQAGKTIELQVNGSLGTANIVTINLD